MIIDAVFSSIGSNGSAYLNWTPRKLTIRLLDAQGANPARVKLTSSGSVQLIFSTTRAAPGQETLEIDLPQGGGAVEAWVAGRFGSASTQDGDSGYRIEDSANGAELV